MSKTRRIAMDGVLAAVYFALSALTFTVGSLQIRFTALALIVAALLFTTLDACAVALVGELLYQIILFGLTATTPVWLAPPLLHGLLLGLSAGLIRKKLPENRQIPAFFAACIVCGLLNACFNTAALYVDAHVYHYYHPETFFVQALVRLGVSVLTAVVTAAAGLPLARLLRPAVNQ